MDRDTVEPEVESVPGTNASRWVDYHHQFAAPSTYVYDFVWQTTTDAIGPFCTDVDGNIFLDFTSHVGASPLGYNNPPLLEQCREFDLVDPMKIAGQDWYLSTGWPPETPSLPGPSQLMERIVDCCSSYDFDRVFLSNSGAEAVENAIKCCYDTGGHRGITTVGAFHGRTLGALSLNRSKAIHRRGFPEIPGIFTIPFPSTQTAYETHWLTDGPGGNLLADWLDPAAGHVDPTEIAYCILEPIQGEGGISVAHPDFLADIDTLRNQYDLRIIVDEIQTGLGRTGTMWAIDRYDLTPDVITCAKGLRVGATVGRSAVFPNESGRLSSTWGGGDILSSMVGALTIDVIREHDLSKNAEKRGNSLRSQIADISCEAITDIRGRGLMIGVEFESSDRRDAVIDAAFERGLLTLGCGDRTLRLLPPLDVTEREITLGVGLLTEAIEATAIRL